jgi:hypothetical protein
LHCGDDFVGEQMRDVGALGEHLAAELIGVERRDPLEVLGDRVVAVSWLASWGLRGLRADW